MESFVSAPKQILLKHYGRLKNHQKVNFFLGGGGGGHIIWAALAPKVFLSDALLTLN